MKRTVFAAAIVAAALVHSAWGQPMAGPAAPQPVARPPVERFLIEGKLAEGEAAMKAALAADPADDQARFSLGVVQVLRAVERRVQQLMRFGIRSDIAPVLPGIRVPIPQNGEPEAITYDKLRTIVQEFVTDMDTAAGTLAAVKDPAVKLPLRIGLIRLDVNGDGTANEQEALWHAAELLSGAAFDMQDGGDNDEWIDEYERQVTSGGMDQQQQQQALAQIARMRADSAAHRAERQRSANERSKQLEQQAQEFVIGFDYADVQWLVGYTNLLAALGETMLSFDSHELFDHAAHLVFPKVQTPYPFLKEQTQWMYGISPEQICDLIAAAHLVNFPITEPKRLTRALEHFQTVTAQSRRMWKAIDAETDDDNEWIPGPKQTGVMPNMRVTEEMRQGWDQFLDELDAILAGKTLVPHWRVRDGRGINLRRVFTEPPKRFDAVLWVQGTEAVPYLEKGPLSQGATWERINSLMNGQLGVLAAWWN